MAVFWMMFDKMKKKKVKFVFWWMTSKVVVNGHWQERFLTNSSFNSFLSFFNLCIRIKEFQLFHLNSLLSISVNFLFTSFELRSIFVHLRTFLQYSVYDFVRQFSDHFLSIFSSFEVLHIKNQSMLWTQLKTEFQNEWVGGWNQNYSKRVSSTCLGLKFGVQTQRLFEWNWSFFVANCIRC